MKKLVKGAVVITMATGLCLWNMESQKVIAIAPIATMDKIAEEEILENLIVENMQQGSVDKEEQVKVVRLNTLQKERVQQRKAEEKKALLKKQRLERKKEIQACCGVSVSQKDRTILERIVEAEAGDQDHKGKLLVANVILNRVKNPSFPSSIKKVVFAHRQFSPIWDGRYKTVTVSSETRKAVDDALNGEDGSQGALYFMDRTYSDSSNITWFDTCLTRLFRHQSHEFFK